ncbi:MAG: aminopeptidase [Candidatus Thermoplasmatota archaeon]|nr:aminopeptidase [Candidatus Thermoplasmatota archaeon]
MIEVDLGEIADKVVNQCMKVEEDEVIQVNGGPHNFDMIEEIALSVRKNGAFPVIKSNSDSLEKKMIEGVDIDYLEKTPEYYLNWLDDIDGVIGVDHQRDPRQLSELSEEKIGAKRRGKRKINDKFQEDNIRWTGIGYPTEEKAEMYGIEYEDFWNMFWKAMNTDYEELHEEGKSIADEMRGEDEVHITSNKGTDLNFSIEDRRIIVDDGIIDDDDLENGDVGNNLPAGEVFCAPLEESAEGEVFFDLAFYKGNKIEGITARFEEGKIVDVEADKNGDVFNEVLEHSHGDKDRIGEFGIGINPEVNQAIGYTLTDEKIMGSIHIALGENRSFGGENESTLHWDLVMLEPTVEVGDKTIIEEGVHQI